MSPGPCHSPVPTAPQEVGQCRHPFAPVPAATSGCSSSACCWRWRRCWSPRRPSPPHERGRPWRGPGGHGRPADQGPRGPGGRCLPGRLGPADRQRPRRRGGRPGPGRRGDSQAGHPYQRQPPAGPGRPRHRRDGPGRGQLGVDLASNTVLVSVPAGAGAAFVAKARSFGPAVRVERTPAPGRPPAGRRLARWPPPASPATTTGPSGSATRPPWTRAAACSTTAPSVTSPAPAGSRSAPRPARPGRPRARPAAPSRPPTSGSVNYAEGTVSGLTRTNICTQPGDSGGALYAGSRA